jgi:hypothetical protein
MKENLPKIYLDFIEECKMKDCSNLLTHRHHIRPKFMGGDNSDDNLIILSVEDHFMAHKILAENCEGRYRAGNLKSAAYLVNRYSTLNISKEEVSKIHSIASKEYLKYNVPFRMGKTGYKYTEEHSLNLSKSLKKYYKYNDVWNKNKKCESISKSLKKWHELNDNPFKNKTHSNETKKRMKENHADFSGCKNPASKKCIDSETDIVYGCIKDMASGVGVPRTTMNRWIKDERKERFKYISYE